jgi:hypothetical protein
MNYLFGLRLNKMDTKPGNPIEYYWQVNNEQMQVNELLDKSISLSFSGNLYCIKCGKKTSKLYQQGYCYSCFTTAPETEECVFRPELCKAHEGIARDMEYARQHCLIDHFVYLAATDQIKVGVTRSTQIPTRWIDQGASSAIIIAKTPNRYLAGEIEVALKNFFPDKTNWRAMLTNSVLAHPDYEEALRKIPILLPDILHQYLLGNQSIEMLYYPVIAYPNKVTNIDLLKTPEVSGIIKGIKGQYLIFDDGKVLNIRRHSGFEVDINIISR